MVAHIIRASAKPMFGIIAMTLVLFPTTSFEQALARKTTLASALWSLVAIVTVRNPALTPDRRCLHRVHSTAVQGHAVREQRTCARHSKAA